MLKRQGLKVIASVLAIICVVNVFGMFTLNVSAECTVYINPKGLTVSNGEYPVVEGYNLIVLDSSYDSGVYIYFWDKETGLEYEEWPGVSMRRCSNNLTSEYLYYYYVPDEYDACVFKYRYESSKSVDVDITGNMGVVFDELVDNLLTVDYWMPNFCQPDAYPTQLGGAVDVWPGLPMSKVEGTENTYYYDIPVEYDNFIFSDGNYYFGFNDGLAWQTEDILFSGSKMYTPNLYDTSYDTSFTYCSVSSIDYGDDSESRRVYFEAPSNWETPSCFCWASENYQPNDEIKTNIAIEDDFKEYMLGSSFSIGVLYSSEIYPHNIETITMDLSGPDEGLIIDGGLSFLGTKEDGIISVSFVAKKIGTYVIAFTTIDGASDSVEITVSEKSLDAYVAQRLVDRNEIMQNTNMLYHSVFSEALDTSDFVSNWVINDEFRANPKYYYEVILLDILLQQSSDLDYISYLNKSIQNISDKCVSYSLDYFQELDEEALKSKKLSELSYAQKQQLDKSYERSTGISNVWSAVSAFVDGTETIGDYFNKLAKYAALRNVNEEYIQVLDRIRVEALITANLSTSLNAALLSTACDDLIEIYSNKNVGIAKCFEDTAETIVWDLTKEAASELLTVIFGGEVAATIKITKEVGLIVANAVFGTEERLKSSCLIKATNYIEYYVKDTLGNIAYEYNYNPEQYAKEYIACHQLLLSCFEYGVSVHSYYEDFLHNKTLEGIIGTLLSKKEKVKYEDRIEAIKYNQLMIADEYKYIDAVVEEYKSYRYGNAPQWVITLDTNDEIGFTSDILVYDGEVIDSYVPTPNRNGYKFLGWYYDKEGTEPLGKNVVANKYLTLYAKWEKEYLVVTDSGVQNTPFANISYLPSPIMYSMRSVEQANTKTIDIPAYMDGYIITGISEYGFANCKDIISVNVPDTITEIGSYAFSNCIWLEKVYVGDSITSIGNDVFSMCDSNLVIHGYENTFIQKYAENNNYKFVVIDDTSVEPTQPSTGGEDKPTDPTEPSTGGEDKPTVPTEPSTGGEDKPTVPTELSTGGEDKPTVPTEPSTGGEDNPTDPTESSTGGEDKPTDSTDPSTGGQDIPTDPTNPVGLDLLGDANEDGKVNIKDATLIQKSIANLTTLTETGEDLADADLNTKINIKDATAIQKHIAGIETGYPIGKPKTN